MALATANELASVLIEQGQYSEAAELARDSLEVLKRVVGPEHPYTLIAANNLAVLLEAQSDVLEVAVDEPFLLQWRARDDFGIQRAVLVGEGATTQSWSNLLPCISTRLHAQAGGQFATQDQPTSGVPFSHFAGK